MKLSELYAVFDALDMEKSTWPTPQNGEELAEQAQLEFEALPRVKYADLPASIQKTIRIKFNVKGLYGFLKECTVDFDSVMKDIPQKDIDKIIIRTRNTATYVIERIEADFINEDTGEHDPRFALWPVLYGNYAVSAFIDTLNQYKAPHTPQAPIQRRKSENNMIDSWARLPAAKMPASPLLYFHARVMNAGQAGPKASRINRHEKIGIAHSPTQNITQYTRIIDQKEYRVTVTDPATALKGGGKTILKLFFFMLQCWAQYGYRREFSFPLSMLVDLGMNTSIDSARVAVKTFMIRQSQFHLSLTTPTGGKGKDKKETKKTSGGVVFYNYQIENNIVTISVNDKMPMQLLANFFTMLPLFAYKLSTKAFNIIYYIMYLARQKGDELSTNNGKFHVSLEAIRQYLELPTPAEVKNHKYYEKIREPIESAIKEVKDNMPDNSFHFEMKQRNTDDSSIAAWLNGDLEIELPAEMAAQFIEIADKAKKHYKQRQRDLEQERAKIAAKAEQKKDKHTNT